MKVAWATLPGADQCYDRVFVTDDAVVVLDGASAFTPDSAPPSQYVDTLGECLATDLAQAPEPLAQVLAGCIARTAAQLDLRPGASPSSTVAIVRTCDDGTADLLVLGDCQITTPLGTYRDDRIRHVALAQRAAYRERLSAGHGYDHTHQGMLRDLQAEEARHRNTPHGFWIAEADHTAAAHAVTTHLPAVAWLVVATDGAYRPMQHLHRDDWANLATATSDDLATLLADLHRWETDTDPTGYLRPRAKQHDDKTLAVVT
ncbi:MAG: hypothetical protein FWF02_12515 [Micrococcales bacterium]|nr:hypothetical protein [Micrococcales bacterium]MCL2668500.1 hypothetical protein [Micrococcales bacterium]